MFGLGLCLAFEVYRCLGIDVRKITGSCFAGVTLGFERLSDDWC